MPRSRTAASVVPSPVVPKVVSGGVPVVVPTTVSAEEAEADSLVFDADSPDVESADVVSTRVVSAGASGPQAARESARVNRESLVGFSMFA